MLKKTLLKNTREFLEKNFPENLSLLKKSSKKQKKLLFSKSNFIKNKLFKLKKKFNKLSNTDNLHKISNANFISDKFVTNFIRNKEKSKIENPLFSMQMIKSEFETKQTRNSDFKNRLKEKKKLSILYGNLSNKQINKALKKAHILTGNTGANLLLLLESRLDVILYRALFFSSIKSARQWIHCNKILVNHNCINISSYQVNPGDVISVIPKNKKFIGSNILKFLNKYRIPSEALQLDSRFTFNYIEPKYNFINTRRHSLNIFKLNSRMQQKKLNCFFKKINKASQQLVSLTKIELNTNNIFRKKNRFIFPNYYCEKLQNKTSYINTFLLKHSIHELNKTFKISKMVKFLLKNLQSKTLLKNQDFAYLQNSHEQKNNFYSGNNEYKLYYNNSLLLNLFKNKKNLFKSKIFLNNIEFFPTWESELHSGALYPKKFKGGGKNYKKNFIYNESNFSEFQNKTLDDDSSNLIQTNSASLQYRKHKVDSILKRMHNKVIHETKKVINLLLGANFFFKHEKTILINILQKVNLTNSYDILFFLKLKKIFYKKRAVSSSLNSVKKINFKPLNLEISYKTLTVIYLYPTQKLVFPCILDTELLTI